MTAPVLDPLRFPLHGSRLIEASAGTGKTWTIAALYVRLVLGHGGDAAGYRRPLLPQEILVVTFTEAATLELRDRIRGRLSQAARCFRRQEPADDYLAALMADYPQSEHGGCARRLEVAAEWMDEAAVFTIHGWCNRMLRQHAFDSGSLFDLELDATDTELVREVARDYWRTYFYPAEPSVCAAVARLWNGPDALLARIGNLLSDTDSLWLAGDRQIAASGDPCRTLQTLGDWLERVAALERAAREAWLAGRDQLESCLREASANGWLNGVSYPKASFEARLRAVAAWALGRGECKPDWLAGFGQSRLKMNGKFQDRCPRHPALQALDALLDAQGEGPQVELEVLAHAAGWLRERFAAEKRRRARLDFDDLLGQLGRALRRDGGERLAELIRGRYPVALIDEFQDTDPLQYGIFDAVYRIGDNRPDLGLFLIGDPKQSLYAFRGADIHSYLGARRATAGRHYTLDRNFRSTAGLIEAVNRIFQRAESFPGGAFRFRGEAENPLPYVTARAHGRPERLLVEGRSAPALTLWHGVGETDQAGIGVGDYRAMMAEATAAAMAGLLNLAGRGLAGFSRGSELAPLRPADLAVLVRDRAEAQAVRDALSRYRLRSVYLSDRESVLDSREAADLLLWLEACAEPEQDRKLRAALATATLDLSYGRLDELGVDELRWEEEVERFRAYRACWRSQGVLPMVWRLLGDFEVPARLLKLEQGERRLTNLLHLAELLQAAAGQLDGEQALVRHLAASLAAPARSAAEMLLRLESDADLIQVVTIHKSKGLEYPLVFVPFACSLREVDGRNSPWFRYHGEGGERLVDLAKSDAARQAADAERLQEDLRLVYVAMTRARHACWLGIAPLRIGNAKASALSRSAIGHLLAGGEPIEPDRLGGLLAEVQRGCQSIAVERPSAGGEAYRAVAARGELAPARHYPGRAAERWWVGSYSALPLAPDSVDALSIEDAPDTPGQAQLLEEEGLGELPALPLAAQAAQTLHAFPSGSRPGTFLHGLLEWAAETGFERVATDGELRADAIARRCQRRSWNHWIPVLDRWLGEFLMEPLTLLEGPLRLRDLAPGSYRAELEFWLAADQVDYGALDRLVSDYILPGQPRPGLLPGQLNGMLKGYIDLAFSHGGRYYVADYKSNRLGPDAAAYTEEAMRQVMLAKRYDLQYALYLLALHRQLKARLAAYDYGRDMGGAAYLFLRAGAAGLYLDKPPRQLIEGLDRLFGDGERIDGA
ncbi:MAG: exodeoxyribonuclease V subunit beta [Methylococcaceae bacterium]|nr:exodeoxyribonuclease V subunit beta [Methylococcaceae bacterium]